MPPEATPRDELLSALLRSYRAAEEFLAADPAGARALPAARGVAEALRAVNARSLVLDPDDPDQALAAAYGLPGWLVSDERPCGLQSVCDLLTTEHGAMIVEARGQGRPDFASDDFDLLCLAVERLLALHSERLLRARIGDVDHSVSALAWRVLFGSSRPALAAAPPARGTPATLLHQRLAEPNPLGAVELELVTRLLRVDVPVVYRPHRVAVVLGLDVELSRSKDNETRTVPASPMKGQVEDSFTAGVANGYEAALRLLSDVGVDPARLREYSQLRFSPRGAGLPLSDPSAALPVALHVLAEVLELEPLAPAATGCLSDEGALEDMGEEVRFKADAVAADGLRPALAARAPKLRHPGLLQLDGTTLGEAAGQLWGPAWTTALHDTAAASLARDRCGFGLLEDQDERAYKIGDVTIAVPSDHYHKVLSHLADNPQTPVVLAGPSGSGKSWTLRLVAAELRSRRWEVLVVRFHEGRLPEPADAVALVGLALRASGLTADVHDGPVLIALEGLEPYQDANKDLDGVLLELVEKFGHSVVAVTTAVQSAKASFEWHDAQTVPSIVQLDDLANFARRLVDAFPEQLGGARGLEGIVATASGGDLWWLVRLLHFVSERAGPFEDPDRLREQFLRERTQGFDDDALSAARSIAACSIIHLPVPRELLAPLDEGQLRRLGAYRVAPASADRWILPSPEASRSLLRADESDGGLVRALHTALVPVLIEFLQAREMAPVLQLLGRAAGEYDGQVRNSLMRENGDLLVLKLREYATAPQLAEALRSLGGGFEDRQRSQLADQLVDRLATRGWSNLAVAQATTCLHAVRSHEHLLAGGDNDAARQVLVELLDQLGHELPQMLARNSTPEQVLGLLEQLREWRQLDLAEQINLCCTYALDQAEAGNGRDMRTFLKLLQFARRVDRTRQRRPNTTELQQELLRSEGARRLVGFRSGPDDDAFVHLTWLAVREGFGEPPPPAEELELQLRSRVARTSPQRLGEGLSLARTHAPALHQAVRRCRLDSEVRELLGGAAPLAAANLLGTLVGVNPRLARNLLLDRDGMPRPALLDRLADRMARNGDLRSAGLLLSACAAVDEEFGQGFKGFSYALSQRLRPMFRALPGERRTSVVVHVTRALVQAQSDKAQIEELRDGFLKSVRRGFTGSSRREHAPQLGLLLAQDDALGPSFLAHLQGAINPADVRSRMQRAESPGALAAYHQFAIAVYPRLSASYELSSLSRMVSGLRSSQSLPVLQAVAAVTRTLGYAGDTTPGRTLLEMVERTPVAWGRRLAAIRNPSDLAQAIDLLADMDGELAREALGHLFTRRRGGSSAGSIVGRLLSEANEPERGLTLLSAVARAHPDLARTVTQRLKANAIWQDRRGTLLDFDDASMQGGVLLQLAELEMKLDDDEAQALLRKWLELARFLRSPRSIRDLVRGLQASHAATALTVAASLDVAGLAARLQLGRPGDNPALAPLLSTLVVVGRPQVAEELASVVAGWPLDRLDLEDASRLLAVVHAFTPAVARELAGRMQPYLAAALGRSFVVDPNQHMLSTGWLARRLANVGAEVPDVDPVVTPSITYHRVARLWGVASLPGTPAGEQRHDLLEQAIAEPPPARPWAAAALLTVAGELGRARELLQGDQERWAHSLSAGPEWLAELVRVGSTDPALHAWLGSHTTELSDVAEVARARGDILGANLAVYPSTDTRPSTTPPDPAPMRSLPPLPGASPEQRHRLPGGR